MCLSVHFSSCIHYYFAVSGRCRRLLPILLFASFVAFVERITADFGRRLLLLSLFSAFRSGRLLTTARSEGPSASSYRLVLYVLAVIGLFLSLAVAPERL